MSSKKYFGTDGIRGTVGQGAMTPEFVLRLAYAAGTAIKEQSAGGTATVLIGKDTRVSGYMLESVLEAGLLSAGVNVVLTGPLPTPALAYLTGTLRMDAAIVISASHNPYDDNGIKFFSGQGTKLSDAVESRIEALLEEPLGCVNSDQMGKADRLRDAAGRYIEFCKSTFPSYLTLGGLKIALDCAHGAGYQVAPAVFHELGATVVKMGCTPTGTNINLECGATDTKALQEFVVSQGADLGIALDGDADRVIMVDSAGNELDGDALLYILAMHKHANGGCTGVSGTVMSNLSLELALKEKGIPFERTKVGDRYVKESLTANKWILGGESSGHVLTLDKHTTGDGIIAALQVLSAILSSGKSLKEAVAGYVACPQVLKSVRLTEASKNWASSETVSRVRAQVEQELGDAGRLVLRASGTEPVVRVMVEHRDGATAARLADILAKAIQG